VITQQQLLPVIIMFPQLVLSSDLLLICVQYIARSALIAREVTVRQL